MAKKENFKKKIHLVKDKEVREFGLEIPNRPIKPKEQTQKPKDDKKQ